MGTLSKLAEVVARRASLVPILFTGMVFIAAFFAGIASGVYGSATHMLINLTGMTAVLSSQQHGLVGYPYAGFGSVREALENGGMTRQPDILAKLQKSFRANYYAPRL